MERETHNLLSGEAKSLIASIAGVVVLAGISNLAFTDQQKKWIRERDENKCNFPGHHRCNGKHGDNIHVHHIMPQRYCHEFNIDPDFPDNGISICENSHQHMIHPDMDKALRDYGSDKNSFSKAFSERNEKIQHREIYWVDKWDRAMQATVYRNTQRFFKRGGRPFPEKKNH